jgi:hypothetical protein
MSYTERFTEGWAIIDQIGPGTYTTEQNSGWNAAANYSRFAVVILTGTITSGGTVDCDIELATDSSGTGGPTTMTSKSITQLTSADSNKRVVIELRPEEFIQSGTSYDYFQVELTCATQNCVVAVLVLGYTMYKPASTTGIDEVVD